jgi:hypothetical protein
VAWWDFFFFPGHQFGAEHWNIQLEIHCVLFAKDI